MSFLPINLLNVQAATGFDYPPGLYLFQVESTEVRANNDGQGQRLMVSNVIVMGPGSSTQYAGRKLANSYQISEKGAPFMKRFFISCGIGDDYIAQNGGQVDPDWLVGRQFVATVAKNGQYTNISNERPASEWNAANVAAAPKAQAPTPSAPPPQMLAPQPMAQAPATYAPPPMAQPMQYANAPVQQPIPQPQMGIPAGIPAPVPPPGRIGQ